MKNLVCLSKLITARTIPRANAKSYLIAILLSLVSLATPVSSYGDSRMGTVHGTVSVIGPDGRRYSASGAKVQLIGTPLSASLVVLAADSGEYKFGSVPPGTYKLKVRPKVSLRNRFYPRDSQGSLGSANSGMFSNGVSRMLGMGFVIEKK